MAIKAISQRVAPVIDQFVSNHFEVICANVSTQDGFLIYQQVGQDMDTAADQVSALASSIFAMAEAAADAVNGGGARLTLIESQRANVFFVRNRCLGADLVMTVAASNQISIGQSLFLVNRLGRQLESLSRS